MCTSSQAFASHGQAQVEAYRFHGVAEPRTDWLCHGDVGDAALVEEAPSQRYGAFGELVHDHEAARRQLVAQAADR